MHPMSAAFARADGAKDSWQLRQQADLGANVCASTILPEIK